MTATAAVLLCCAVLCSDLALMSTFVHTVVVVCLCFSCCLSVCLSVWRRAVAAVVAGCGGSSSLPTQILTRACLLACSIYQARRLCIRRARHCGCSVV
ncbi:hypothetical protein IWZ03DRAFT_2691 [Phyllosticta citriasiana]|uniref:Uncharacterized protein n=1 Tax=Phyllosticta citriasiana TaxID=595635 RepID=A0ABR1KWY7_9PEZI